MSEIRVPVLGESIVEATVANWIKQAGDRVNAGETICELETDKVNVEVMAEESGVLRSILKPAGATVQVGEAIGVIEPGQAPTVPAVSATAAADRAQAQVASVSGAPSQPEVANGRGAVDQPTPRQAPTDIAPSPELAALSEQAAMRATPAVRRLAYQLGVDLTQLPSSAVGRITESDVIHQAQAGLKVQTSPAGANKTGSMSDTRPSVPSPQSDLRSDEKLEPMSRRRITIAKRLVEVQHTAAMLTTFNEVDMTKVMEVRKRRKDKFKEAHGVSLGFMSFFTKAAVAALKAFPRLNAEIRGNDIILKYHYDIGVAVATEGGLVVPVVRDADRLRFADIEQEIATLAEKARSSTLSLTDLQGGTFTITNGGVFGSLFSTPILNAPQVGILGMHGIVQRPIAVGGQVEIRPMMYIALSYDHRIVDGSEAVRFLVKIKQVIEDPEELLLEG